MFAAAAVPDVLIAEADPWTADLLAQLVLASRPDAHIQRFTDGEAALAILENEEDFDLVLRPTAGGWQAIHALPPGSDWNLTLSPVDGHWRLQGRLQHDTRKATLQPALAAP